MRKLILCSSCVLALGASAPVIAAQGAPPAVRSTCDAKYFGYLVGRSLDEARAIEGVNYRVLSATAARGAADPKRMTVVFDPASNRITEVGCG